MVAGRPCGEERPIALISRMGVRAGGTSAQVRTSWRGGRAIWKLPPPPETLRFTCLGFSFLLLPLALATDFFFSFEVMVFSTSRVERETEAGRKG